MYTCNVHAMHVQYIICIVPNRTQSEARVARTHYRIYIYLVAVALK